MEKMRIAFFNWRDINHPAAGGAEVYNHELLKPLAEQGHKITIFTSSFPGCKEKEVIDRIEHIRYGGKFGIYPKAYFCYKKYVEGKYDVIVEGINGMPFFTKFFARESVVPLVYQLTRKNWYSGLPLPLAFAGFHSEDFLLRVYRKQPTITISESTRMDLEKLGFGDLNVIYASADITPPKEIRKEKKKTLVYLGRITKSKRVDHVLQAFRIIRESTDAQLWIVGSGPEEKHMQQLAKELKISGQTKFFGKVNQEKKAELLSKAHIKLFPAVREGWGIVALEANVCGTPVIGYNVHGLRDSVKEGVNGFLVDDGNVQEMAKCAVELLGDEKALRDISLDSIEYSKKFNWEKSSKEFASLLKRVIG